ncbi:MAG: hypothetical protein Q8M83_05405, partial [bacterium]|nr:hypothetical protein [bacterium]
YHFCSPLERKHAMKSMKVEILFLVIVLFVGIAANKAPLAYGEKNSLAYPVIYPRSLGTYDLDFRQNLTTERNCVKLRA